MKKLLKGLFVVTSVYAILGNLMGCKMLNNHIEDVQDWADNGDDYASGYNMAYKLFNH